MILFSNDKEIVFKLTNAFLLIWLIAATAISVGNIINLVLKEPMIDRTYEEYAALNCSYLKEELDELEADNICLSQYKDDQFYKDNSDFYAFRNLAISTSNVLIVGGVLFFLNRKKEV